MNELTKQALYHSLDDELMHYGKEGMRWGYRHYQPYSQGYDADHKGVFLGKYSNKAYRYTDKKDAMSYLTGKRSAYDEVRRGSSSLYDLKSKLKSKASDARTSFDKWNRMEPQYSKATADKLKKDTIRLQNEASSWRTKLYEAQDQARRNAITRAHNEQRGYQDKRDYESLKRSEQRVKDEGYERYYTDREKEVIDSLERIASHYTGKSDLAARRYFRYEDKSTAPATRVEAYEQAAKRRVEDVKQYAKSYARTFASLMQTDVTEIPDASSRMKYQKQIDEMTKSAFKMRTAQNLTGALKQARTDIDKDLIAYYSGKTSILPEKAVIMKFFEYDAD